MTTAQKIIKNLAIAFAIFLIIVIVSAILGGIYGLASILGLNHQHEILGEMVVTSFENSDVKKLDVDVVFTNLAIKVGDTLKVETNNDSILCKEGQQTLQIKEENNNWFFGENKGDLIIYIPKNMKFENMEIHTGAGKISIEELNTEKLELELGAGETEIEKLEVTRNCKINGGAGKVSVLSGTIHNFDLDMGIGEINLTANIKGKSDIEAGVGNLNITLQGDKESYKIKTNKGIGKIKIDGKEMKEAEVFGDGENDISIDGGIGNIILEFSN